MDRTQTLRERIGFLRQYLAEGIEPGLAQLTREAKAAEQPEAR